MRVGTIGGGQDDKTRVEQSRNGLFVLCEVRDSILLEQRALQNLGICRVVAVNEERYLTEIPPSFTGSQRIVVPFFAVAAERFLDEAAAGDLVAVDEDKATGRRQCGIHVKGDLVFTGEGAVGNRMLSGGGGRVVLFEIGGIEYAVDRRYLAGRFCRAGFDPVLLAHHQRIGTQPEHTCAERLADPGNLLADLAGDLTAPDIDLRCGREPAGFAICDLCRLRMGGGIHVPLFDPRYIGRFAGRIEDQVITGPQCTGFTHTRDNPSVVAALGEFVHVLHRDPQRQRIVVGTADKSVEHFQYGRAVVPGGVRRVCGNVVAVHGRDRDIRRRFDADFRKKFREIPADLVVARTVVADQVDLVHEYGDLRDPEHFEHIAVPSGIFADSLRRVDDEQCRLCPGRAGDHILEKFDMPGCVDDDVFPFFRFKEAARRIDGDPLRPLVLQCVQQKRVFKRLGIAAAHFPDLLDLAIRQRMRIREQTTDHGAFAMIHVSRHYDIHMLLICHIVPR